MIVKEEQSVKAWLEIVVSIELLLKVTFFNEVHPEKTADSIEV